MTTERQRIKIAELQGFSECWICPCSCGDARGKRGTDIHWTRLPDYLNSRDALAPVLAGLTDAEQGVFVEYLVDATNAKRKWLAANALQNVWKHRKIELYKIATATPAQLGEAYLRTKGEWEDGK